MGSWGVTQGDPLSPTIFNVVVDVVVCHWVSVMVEGAEDQGKREQEVRHQNSLFYKDDGMVASLESQWLQGVLAPWSACSTGWAWGPIFGRLSAWSSDRARRQGLSRRWNMRYR